MYSQQLPKCQQRQPQVFTLNCQINTSDLSKLRHHKKVLENFWKFISQERHSRIFMRSAYYLYFKIVMSNFSEKLRKFSFIFLSQIQMMKDDFQLLTLHHWTSNSDSVGVNVKIFIIKFQTRLVSYLSFNGSALLSCERKRHITTSLSEKK